MLTWDRDQVETSSQRSSGDDASVPELEFVTDRVPSPPPHPLRDAIDSELQQLRDADLSEHESYHDPDSD